MLVVYQDVGVLGFGNYFGMVDWWGNFEEGVILGVDVEYFGVVQFRGVQLQVGVY